MGRHTMPTEKVGGLHGTWLKLLGVISIAVVVVAVWQLTASSRGDDPPPTGDGAELSSMEISPAPDTAVADSSPSSSTTTNLSTSPSVGPSSDSGSSASPEPSAEEEIPEPPPETTEAAPPPAEPGCSAALRLDHSWRGYVQVAVVVTASDGERIDGWKVDLDVDGVEIYQFWNMSHHRGDTYRNEHWNGRLSPGEETEAAFLAEVGRHYELPDSVPCVPVA
ncbi:cellulose binding domain-containing protein [Glycomyces salinus]|uniref:cellulose binding domain-containing protein n=1 Tax=Glycomyces salinus TaxID=980294 RepID=UPI0018ED9517|nr:cellulose binding domain-containing protein [Glycomyces salinus]